MRQIALPATKRVAAIRALLMVQPPERLVAKLSVDGASSIDCNISIGDLGVGEVGIFGAMGGL